MKKFRPLVLDTDSLRDRMTARLLEIKKTTRGAARDAGIGESTIRNLMEGRSKSPRMGTLVQIAKALDVGPGWFFLSAIHEDDEPVENRMRVDMNDWLESHAVESPESTFGEKNDRLNQILNDQIQMIYPVLRKDGSYLLDYSALGIFSSKPSLPDMRLFSQYILLVRNDRMWPVFRKQDRLLISPDIKLKNDEDYVFRKKEEGGKWQGWLARLRSYDDQMFHITLFNPREDLSLDRSIWIRAEAVAARLFLPDGDENEQTAEI